jgi:hypothetical protein
MMRRQDNEKELAIAFLRSGHPWLAFAIVIVKAGTRVVVTGALVAGALIIGPAGASAFVKVLPAFF